MSERKDTSSDKIENNILKNLSMKNYINKNDKFRLIFTLLIFFFAL